MKNKEASTPDMLMITDWGTSNFNEVKTYIVRSGELRRVTYVDNKGKKIDDSYSASRDDGIRTLSGARVQFKNYNNLQFVYGVNTFKLNVNKSELRLEDTRNLRSKAWPNSGVGDRAYLKSLKEAALKGALPGRTDIKIGMTLQNAQKSWGNQPLVQMRNGERSIIILNSASDLIHTCTSLPINHVLPFLICTMRSRICHHGM